MARKKIFVEQIDQVAVVNFSHSSLFNPHQVEEVMSDLMHMIIEENCRLMLLDFSRVRSFSSAFLGSLLDLKALCDRQQARLALTGLSKQLLELIHKIHLHEALAICADREEGLAYLKRQSDNPEGQTEAQA